MTPVDYVEQALQLSPARVGEALATLPEDQWLERKSAGVRGQAIANLLVGFANAEGGTIIIGLSDDGGVEGINSAGPKRLTNWQRAHIDFVTPPIRCQFRRMDCITVAGKPDQLAVIKVESTDKVHANNRDEIFLRVGRETRKLNLKQQRELLYDKGQTSFESTSVDGATLNDLDRGLVDSYADCLSHSSAERLLSTRGLINRDGRVTIAAVLLFAFEPQQWFPQAFVQVLRYRGSERGFGARQQLLSDVRVEGPIPRVIGEARKAVLGQLPTRHTLTSSGRFEPVPLLPLDAWLGGLVNAVMHRSYSHSGDHIRVEIFDDRLEIESPGRFSSLSDHSDPLQITCFARNPLVARVCADLRFSQGLGKGIRRMFNEMKLVSLGDPEYHQTSGSVRLTLSWTTVDRDLDDRLPQPVRYLLQLIRSGDRLSTGDLAEDTGRSRPVVLRQLQILQEEGLISRVGNSSNDPHAYWKLSG